MKLLLGLISLLTSGLCIPPAPLNPSVSGVNFRYNVSWTPAPGSTPGLTYHIYRCSKACSKDVLRCKQLRSTSRSWTFVRLRPFNQTFYICLRSSNNNSFSALSKKTMFNPDVDTVVTAPHVALWGAGKGIWVNISLPSAHRDSGITDLREVYRGLEYRVTWRPREDGDQTEESTETKNQTFLIPNLQRDTEYCVQVQPFYLQVKFDPSSWSCVFTSITPPSPVPAAVGSAVVLVVLVPLVLVVLVFGLQYSGFLGKVREALPRALTTGLQQRSFLRPEPAVLEPVSLLPGTRTGTETHRRRDWDQDDDEDDQEPGAHSRPDEEQYLNRGADLSSDTSSRAGHVTSSDQSAATISDQTEASEEMGAGLQGETMPCLEPVHNVVANDERRELQDDGRRELQDDGRRELQDDGGRRELQDDGGRRELQDDGGRRELQDDGGREQQDDRRRALQDDGRRALQDDGRRELQDDGGRRELQDEGQRRELQDDGRRALQDDGRRALQDYGRRELQDDGRRELQDEGQRRELQDNGRRREQQDEGRREQQDDDNDDEGVDLFSVTVAALRPQDHQGESDHQESDHQESDHQESDHQGESDHQESDQSVDDESEQLSLNCYLQH